MFWEINYGPTFLDVAVFDAWLSHLPGGLGRGAARLRLQPPVPLERGGDAIEPVLERHGFVRQRPYGGWTTLLLDISREESEILSGFRDATRRAIKKSGRLGVEVRPEDTRDGWRVVADLQTELRRRAPVPPLNEDMMERISPGWLRNGAGGTVLVARHRGEPVAAALVVTHRGTAYLPVVPSCRRNGDIPASHLLVWEAIRWAKKQGCSALDFVGYAMAAEPGDSLAGINQFKRGFAPLDNLIRYVAMHEKVFNPAVVGLASRARRTQSCFSRLSQPAPASSTTQESE
jgi:hypothetical protein